MKNSKQNVQALPIPFVLLGMLMTDSLHHVFARALQPHFPSTIGAFWVMSTAAFALGIYLVVTKQFDGSVFTENWRFFVTIGVLIAFATWLSYESLSYVDAGTASLLSRSGIIFAIALGLFWLKEKLSTVEWVGAAVSLAGVLIISFQPGLDLRWGAVLVLLASFSYTLHTAVVKRYGQEMDFANFFFFRVATTAMFSLFIALSQEGTVLIATPINSWLLIGLVSAVDVIVSRVLYYWALRAIDLSYHTILLMISPVVTIGWSLLFFREQPTWLAIGGGTAVLIGQFIIMRYRQSNKSS